jgi:hypothetical protein
MTAFDRTLAFQILRDGVLSCSGRVYLGRRREGLDRIGEALMTIVPGK